MSAASTFAGIPELVQFVVDEIHSRKELGCLRLVSRVFQNAATPAFFRDYVWTSVDLPEKYAHLIRTLEAENPEDFFLEEIAERAPQLEKLLVTVAHPPGRAGLEALQKNCPKLRALHFQFDDDTSENSLKVRKMGRWAESEEEEEEGDDSEGDDDDDDDDYDYEARERELYKELPDFSMFTQLTELVIDRLYSPLQEWPSLLAATLKNNAATLRLLHLSICRSAIEWQMNDDSTLYRDLFGQICRKYKYLSAPPLRLEELRFGPGMYPHLHDQDTLLHCIDTSCLRRLYVANHNLMEELQMFTWASTVVRFFVDPDRCPRLEHVAVEQINENDVQSALLGVRPLDWPDQKLQRFAAQLAFSLWDTRFWRDFDISVKRIDKGELLMAQIAILTPEGGGLRQLDLHLEYNPDARFPVEPDPATPEQLLQDLGESEHRNTLTGLLLFTWFPLQGGDKGGYDGFFKHWDAFLAVLPKMQRLTELSVVAYDEDKQRGSPLTDVLSPSAQKEAVLQLARAGPHLRYVQLADKYWRVRRCPDDVIEIQSMHDLEIREVELWNRPNCG